MTNIEEISLSGASSSHLVRSDLALSLILNLVDEDAVDIWSDLAVKQIQLILDPWTLMSL